MNEKQVKTAVCEYFADPLFSDLLVPCQLYIDSEFKKWYP